MKLQRFGALAVVVALGMICASTASAQRGQGGGRGGFGMGRGGGSAMLLMSKPVQEELKLTSDQTEAVTKVAEESMAAMRDSFANLRDASEEERTAAREKMTKMAAETDKKIAGVLKPEQAARLKELSIQSRGPAALMDPEVATALKLSDDQKEKIGEALRPPQGTGGGFGGAGPNATDAERAEARERMQKARAERETKVKGILNADQNEQFTKMQGKKFDFPAPQGRPGAGGGNGGGGGGGQRRRAAT